MKLREILSNVIFLEISDNENLEISSICFDSRKCVKGSLFIALDGTTFDGHNYVTQAVENGAVAVICEKPIECNALIFKVPNSHQALGVISSNFYGNPSKDLKLVGITGTNGKTTTVTLLYQLFTKLGYKCGLLSTISNFIVNKEVPATHTTPDPIGLNSLLQEMTIAGCEYCFMEVSSHSIDQQRISGLHFTGGIFSNITHDHLDYHKTFQEYIRCKKRFFDDLPSSSFALTNVDDRNGEIMLQNCNAKKYKYSCLSPADFNCRIIEKGLDGMLIKLDNSELWSRFIGTHNAYNLLAIYSCAILLGAKKEEILVQISSLSAVSGRLEYIKGGADITAVVDYAHTPDALENVLKTLKDCANDRELITVFGCGGNRDKTKRPEMAVIASKYSDRVVVTSDNPRFEEPEDIIEDIKKGFDTKSKSRTLFITDRKEAIRTAIALAKDGSIVLIAGKGHENYQDIKGVKHHFDDKEIINEVFNN